LVEPAIGPAEAGGWEFHVSPQAVLFRSLAEAVKDGYH